VALLSKTIEIGEVMKVLHEHHINDQAVKQALFWVMVILCLVVALSVGMMIINWSLNTRI